MAPSTEPVWISCRATAGCEGKEAIQTFRQNNAGGGYIVRYKCTTCQKVFHVRT